MPRDLLCKYAWVAEERLLNRHHSIEDYITHYQVTPQRMMLAKNTNLDKSMPNPMMQSQKIMLYVMPIGMLFFQGMLLAGYAFVHWNSTRLSPRAQGRLQLAVIALAFVPFTLAVFAWGSPLTPITSRIARNHGTRSVSLRPIPCRIFSTFSGE